MKVQSSDARFKIQLPDVRLSELGLVLVLMNRDNKDVVQKPPLSKGPSAGSRRNSDTIWLSGSEAVAWLTARGLDISIERFYAKARLWPNMTRTGRSGYSLEQVAQAYEHGHFNRLRARARRRKPKARAVSIKVKV